MQKTLSAALIVLACPAFAQDSDWTYSASIYGWVPSLGATVDTPFGDLEAEGGGNDILASLDMAFMGTFEAWNGRWGLLGDLIYSDLSNSKSTPFGKAYDEGEVAVELAAFSAYGLYRVVNNSQSKVDLAAGFRAYALDIDANLTEGNQPAKNVGNASESWVDPLVGLRGSVGLSDNWALSGAADVGGFGVGSDLTWQVIATIDYHFNAQWSARLGYRHLEIDKPIDGADVNLRLSGPIIGATFHF